MIKKNHKIEENCQNDFKKGDRLLRFYIEAKYISSISFDSFIIMMNGYDNVKIMSSKDNDF